MQLRIVTAAALAATLIAIAGGCSDDDDADGNTDPDAGSGSKTPGDVKCPDGIPDFAANPSSGLEATVKHDTLRARLISAKPVHPTKNAMNDWQVQFMDKDGTAIDDVEVVAACAFMRVHLHGNPPLNGTKKLDDPGQYELDYLNFGMRGPWEVQMVLNRTAQTSGGDLDASVEDEPGTKTPMEFTDCDRMRRHPGAEYAMFSVCVEDE